MIIKFQTPDCAKALPAAERMLARVRRKRRALNLSRSMVSFRQGDYKILVASFERDDLIRISGGFVVDILFLERLGDKRVAIYGFDLLKDRIKFLASTSVASLISTINGGPVIDTSEWLDANINFGLRSEINGRTSLIAIDLRHNQFGDPEVNYYKGIVGEGVISEARLTQKTWKWGDIPDVPDVAYINDTSQSYPLWSSPFPPHVSTQKHVTKSGFEMCYATEWWEHLGGLGTTIRARWFIRDLNKNTPWELLFDLSEPQNFYQEIGPVGVDSDLRFPPHNWDTRWYTYATDSTIYMRILKSDAYTQLSISATAVHEWWTLWREYDAEAKTWGNWELFYDGFWGAYREDTSRWIFQGIISDPLERVTGYVEKKEHSSSPDKYYNLFRFWFVLNGNPMTVPIGYFDINIEELFDIVNGQNRGGSIMECWAMTPFDSYGFLLTTDAVNHPEPVRDALLKRVDGILTTVYSPEATRRLVAGNGRVLSPDGRYYMGQEVNRVNPTGSTNDIILVDMITGAKKVVNRTPAFTQFFGRNVVWPFAFVEPMRNL